MAEKRQTKDGKPLIKILLTCPECGNSTFLEKEDADGETVFECSLCGTEAWIDAMSSVATDTW